MRKAGFGFPETNDSAAITALAVQMDKLLSKEQRDTVIQERSCCKFGIAPESHLAFGR